MNLDIRLPIGMLFSLLGLLLVGYGVVSDASVYRRSLGHNVNLSWGLAVLAFGLVFLWLGRKGTSSVERAEDTPAGRDTEAREHTLGLEHESGEPGPPPA